MGGGVQTSYHVTSTWVEVGLDWIELKLGWMLGWVVTTVNTDKAMRIMVPGTEVIKPVVPSSPLPAGLVKSREGQYLKSYLKHPLKYLI